MEEESGEPIPVKSNGDTSDVVTIVPPPLSPGQVEKIVDAIEAVGDAAKAVGEAIQALGSLYGDYCKWVFRNFKPMLIPPIMPPLGTQPPSTPPPTTPTP